MELNHGPGDGPSYYLLECPLLSLIYFQKNLEQDIGFHGIRLSHVGYPVTYKLKPGFFLEVCRVAIHRWRDIYIYGLLNVSHPTVPVQTPSMQLPPGPLYLLRTFPSFALPSTIVYACLTLAKEHLSLAIPTWFTVFATLLARPVVFIFNRYYSRFTDSRAAAASNAVVAPRVRESPFSIISKISHSLQKDYPGAFWCWPCAPVQN